MEYVNIKPNLNGPGAQLLLLFNHNNHHYLFIKVILTTSSWLENHKIQIAPSLFPSECKYVTIASLLYTIVLCCKREGFTQPFDFIKCVYTVHAPRIGILLNGRCRLGAYPSSNRLKRTNACAFAPAIYTDDLKHAQKKTQIISK